VSSIRSLTREAGISLLEVLVALGILSAVLIALGGLMFQVARNTRQSAVVGYRSAAITSASAWAGGLEWDSIDGSIGCTSDSSGLMAYTRCLTVANPTTRTKELTVVVSPFGALIALPETVVVHRSKPRLVSPFNVP
jgi:type II secretory pathway pseudopilin PulG